MEAAGPILLSSLAGARAEESTAGQRGVLGPGGLRDGRAGRSERGTHGLLYKAPPPPPALLRYK